MGIEQMFEQVYYNDFNEKGAQIGKIGGNLEQLSKRQEISRNFGCRHKEEWEPYEVPLSFKQKGTKIPNNRSQRLKG